MDNLKKRKTFKFLHYLSVTEFVNNFHESYLESGQMPKRKGQWITMCNSGFTNSPSQSLPFRNLLKTRKLLDEKSHNSETFLVHIILKR